MDDQKLGELIGAVRAIKENTDKIPQLSIMLAVHETKIATMEPKVERHESTAQRAMAVAGITGILAGVFSSIFRSMSH